MHAVANPSQGNRPEPPEEFPDGAPMVAGGYRAADTAVKIAVILWLTSVMPITFNYPELPLLSAVLVAL